MKYITYLLILPLLVFSCQKAREDLQEIAEKTTEKVKLKTTEIVNEQVDKQVEELIKSVNISEDILFSEVFLGNGMSVLDSVKGKKIKLPNQSTAIVFKYKADKTALLKFLENQPSEDESNSDKTARKIDGKVMITQLKLAKSFLPESMQESPVLNSIETDQTLEFYRLTRLPVKSTFIYNPKDSTFFHFVELKN